MYIVIEGQDATGKSTQVEMLAGYLRAQGKEVITMHEPDGDLDAAHELRRIIKDKTYNLEPMTHVLLFTAARQELWRKLAEPVLKRDGYVISARNWWSTLAYQGYGQGISRSRIIRITKEAMPERYVKPDKSVILTLDEKTRLARQNARDDNSAKDTFESKPSDFQHKVDAAYLHIAKDLNVQTVDASPSADEIQTTLRKIFGV
jgi:dTMP kinase